jgi:hypothetical protein
MTFADLATGDAVFVDANTLIHLFQPHPQLGPFCRQLIQRIDNQDLVGFTLCWLRPSRSASSLAC